MKYFTRIKLTILLGMVSVIAFNADSQVVNEQKPEMNQYTEKEPGETIPLQRPYDISPPLVPHNVKGFNITRTANDCLDCHKDGDEIDKDHIATKVPASHYVNEFTEKKEEGQVTGIRYNCTQCHVPQATAESPFEQMKDK